MADGDCMMLFYGQESRPTANGRRRRNVQNHADAFSRKRRAVDFAAQFVQCVQSRVKEHNLNGEQINWLNSWVAGFTSEQEALCKNAPNPSIVA